MQYSILNYSELDDYCFRIDADYYQLHYLEAERLLLKKSAKKLTDFIDELTDGKHGGVNFTNSGVVFIRNQNNKEGIIDISDKKFISIEESEKTKRAEIQPNDILLTTIGTIGISSVVPVKFPRATINQNLVRIKVTEINPYYISTFFNCKYGKLSISRLAAGNIQPIINYPNLRNIIIPQFSKIFQGAIEEINLNNQQTIKKSHEKYNDAQTLLLSELGLLDWKPKHRLSFIKNYSDTQQIERIDAEYYQPKYDEIVAEIKNYAGGWDTVKNILNIKDKNISPKHNVEYKYIELANIGNNGEITGFTEAEGQDLPTRARRKVSKDNVIVSSIEGSLSSIALIPAEYDGALCSTGFYVVDSDKLNTQTLLVLLKSPIGQEQLKKGCSGTILTAINKDEIEKIVLPIVDSEIQNQIQQKITESFNLKKQSKHLLECAKKAVEMAIEKDEETAMQWLESQIDNKEGIINANRL